VKNDDDDDDQILNSDDNSLKLERLSCFYLFKKYFKEVFVRMQQFKDELLSSTLEFALSLPKELVEINLNEEFTCLEVRENKQKHLNKCKYFLIYIECFRYWHWILTYS
jgi:hypothetical protein